MFKHRNRLHVFRIVLCTSQVVLHWRRQLWGPRLPTVSLFGLLQSRTHSDILLHVTD